MKSGDASKERIMAGVSRNRSAHEGGHPREKKQSLFADRCQRYFSRDSGPGSHRAGGGISGGDDRGGEGGGRPSGWTTRAGVFTVRFWKVKSIFAVLAAGSGDGAGPAGSWLVPALVDLARRRRKQAVGAVCAGRWGVRWVRIAESQQNWWRLCGIRLDVGRKLGKPLGRDRSGIARHICFSRYCSGLPCAVTSRFGGESWIVFASSSRMCASIDGAG
jgi:hypothetical protein